MALSVKNKQSFGNSQHSHAKMCLQDQIKRSMAAPSVSWPTPMRAIGAQNLLTMPGGVTTSGYLHKKGGSQFSLLKWPLRFIIIHKGCVYYFKSSTSATPQGAFSLKGYNRILRAAEETTSSNVFPFKIVHFSKTHRTWYFSAASEDERRKWMRHLRKEIDHYNDKRELQIPSSDDSDAESVYGPLEEPVEIIDFEDDYEADYMTQDEDSDGEDNHKQDQPPVPPGRPMVPPPPYPPPPVPHLSRENRQTNRPPPPLPPSLKKPPCCIPLNKGPPPPLPFAPHLQKPDIPHRSSAGPMPVPASFATIPLCERKPKNSLVGNTATTLPIVENLEKVVLNSGNKPPTSSNHLGSKTHLAQIPKPPIPTKPKPSRPSLQRASPDGQSFRSSLEENPLNKRFPQKSSEDSDVDDDGYENVQLPPSVFVETTETSSVERLFKETYSCPLNGLYCIRKSGTGKTSQVLVVWDVNINKARNYRLFKEDQRVYVETEVTFPTLDALVEHYYINALPSSHNSLPHSSLCLQIPYGYNPPR